MLTAAAEKGRLGWVVPRCAAAITQVLLNGQRDIVRRCRCVESIHPHQVHQVEDADAVGARVRLQEGPDRVRRRVDAAHTEQVAADGRAGVLGARRSGRCRWP